jgi:pSer/pThr/pTyr-binding forkhead associated (FHA) protein
MGSLPVRRRYGRGAGPGPGSVRQKGPVMRLRNARPPSRFTRLSADTGPALADEIASAEPGTLFVLGPDNGVRAAPARTSEVVFGRNEHEVAVCVGGDDTSVSRRHGLIRRRGSRWMVKNLGARPIWLPDSRMLCQGNWAKLSPPRTPLFVLSSRGVHLVDVRIAGRTVAPDADIATLPTGNDARDLTARQTLVVTCLAQRYLRQEPFAQPMPWSSVADQLVRLRPDEDWSESKARHEIERLREKLSAMGVRGLTAKDVPDATGNILNHNLILDLLITTTITPGNLRDLD